MFSVPMIREIWWRHFGCPRSVDKAAVDFFINHLTEEGRSFLRRTSGNEIQSMKTLDQRRRIAYIYGLAKDGSWKFAWNHQLLRDAKTKEPEIAAIAILESARCIAIAESGPFEDGWRD